MKTDLGAFEHRRQHAANKIKWSVPPELRGRFLDIGCGIGNGVVAAVQAGFTQAVGIDRDFQEFGWFEIAEFDAICAHYMIDPNKALMIEGDVFQVKFPKESFDCVFMLDTIERVPNPRAFIETAAQYVAPGGVLLIDTCPLYYSKAGHHLFNHLPPDRYPWAHLRRDFKELCAQHSVDDWSWQRFQELNRVTHAYVRQAMEDSGLSIIQEHRGEPTEEDRNLLEAHRPVLNIEGLEERWLFEDWLLLVGRRPD